jgi:maltose O-acetyltransferase
LERIRNWVFHLGMRLAMSPLFPATIGRPTLLRLIGVKLPRTSTIGSGTVIGGPWHAFGERVFVNTDCFLDGAASIYIGDDVRIGARAVIITGAHDIEEGTVRRDPTQATMRLPVTIGRGTWIGAGCTVLPGVIIAEGCVIGAGSVVTKSTEPNGLYVGNPARRMRDLPTGDLSVTLMPAGFSAVPSASRQLLRS